MGFNYLLMGICGSFTLGRLLDFISAHFWFNGALLFSEELLSRVFKNSVFINIVFLMGKNNILYLSRFCIRIYSLHCYLYDGEFFFSNFQS